MARYAGGGAGNPGGLGGVNTSGTTDDIGNNATYKGANGTGGLLIIVANDFNNLSKCESNGSDGGGGPHVGGGASGAGSINIFAKKITNIGEMQAIGGVENASPNNGGAGGKGSVTIGTISSKSFQNL